MNYQTAWTIATQDVFCTFRGPLIHGKYQGWILLADGGKPLYKSESVFGSAEQATNDMKHIVASLRETLGNIKNKKVDIEL